MRLVVATSEGRLEFAFMMVPLFLAYDTELRTKIETTLEPELRGKPLTDATIDYAHNRVLDIICDKHKELVGLRDYLDAIKFIHQPGS